MNTQAFHHPQAAFEHRNISLKKICARSAALGAGWLLMFSTLTALADVKLPAVISDHMVLQAGDEVTIWGWANPDEPVSVEIGRQKLDTRADVNGRWRVTLKPLRAGAQLTLTVVGANKLVVKDVLVGEVWLGSGQSNMGMRVSSANRFEAEKATADFPEIRMFTVVAKASPVLLDDCQGTWQVCHSNTVGNFSAALYFFGRDLHQRLKVPVGLIHSSWGGTPIQPWMSLEVLKEYPGYAALLERKQKEIAAWPARREKLEADLKAWETAAVKARAAGQPEPPKPWNPGPPDSGQYMPGQLYNAMIHPLLPYRIRGAVWYQGEANAGGGWAGAADYTDLQSRMITGWRKDWGIGDFPFLYVQLPNWNTGGDQARASWAFFREGQANILKVTNTSMAVTIDIGQAGNIHPPNKQDVGYRLACLALADVYQVKVASRGPSPTKQEMNGRELVISFSHADGGLVSKGGELKGFVVAGADRRWHSASARIQGERVVISCAEVVAPVAVRYAWADNPECNLYNAAGLPAAPFRTDNWP